MYTFIKIVVCHTFIENNTSPKYFYFTGRFKKKIEKTKKNLLK